MLLPLQVDMHKKLTDIGLVHLLPSEAWPPTNAVRELATKIKRVSRGSDMSFFVAVDLRK